jgi:hypothetical protein
MEQSNRLCLQLGPRRLSMLVMRATRPEQRKNVNTKMKGTTLTVKRLTCQQKGKMPEQETAAVSTFKSREGSYEPQGKTSRMPMTPWVLRVLLQKYQPLPLPMSSPSQGLVCSP